MAPKYVEGYRGWSICETPGYFLVIKDNDCDFEQIPFSTVDEAKAWIDTPSLVKQVKRLNQQMLAGNMDAATTLQEIGRMLHEQDVTDDFFAHFSQDERKGILAAYLNTAGRELAR